MREKERERGARERGRERENEGHRDRERVGRDKEGEREWKAEREIAELPVRTPTIMQSSTPGPRVNDRRTATNLDVRTSV